MNAIKENIVICFLIISVNLTIITPLYAGISNFTEAVNNSGRQRMLTQRILKSYTLVGMENDIGNPGEDLKQKVELFDTTLEELDKFNTNSEIAKKINSIKGLWSPIKQKLLEKPKFEESATLQNDLDSLLNSCDTLTKLFIKVSGRTSTSIINISGRQRMLSQRLAALYLLKVWGTDDPKFQNKLEETMLEFSEAQKKLELNSSNTKEIRARLATVKKLFKWFEIMGRSTSGRYVPSLISRSSDKILNEMNIITNLYIKNF